MSSPLNQLSFDPHLAFEFLSVFARYEFALKAGGFADGDDRGVTAAWDRYAASIDAQFARLESAELSAAIEYLLGHPPKKQVLANGELAWRDLPPNAKQPRAVQVLLMVRRVRNNLFHGGKFLPTKAGNDRDRLLVNHSLVVLRACLPLNDRIDAAYRY